MMGMMRHPGRSGRKEAGNRASSRRFDVSMRLSVCEAGLLWRMAAAQALSHGGLTEEDVVEMFGPMEDPSLADCIAMLAGPDNLAGCRFEEFSVVSAGAAVGHAGGAGPAHAAPGRTSLVLRIREGCTRSRTPDGPEPGMTERK